MGDAPIVYRVFERLAQGGVDIRERPVGEVGIPLLAVEATDISTAQVLELAPSEFGDDVMANIAPVGVVCGAANGSLDPIG